jgi:hypothetical protein
MKPAISAIALSLLLGALGYILGRPLDVYDYVVVIFATSIVVWTFEQYFPHRHQH